jgi:uncharacterized cupin superfamily protein
LREEFVLVLRGSPSLCIGRTCRQLAPGDYANLAAGSGLVHYLCNEGHEEAHYLLIASVERDDVIIYRRPD